MSNSQFAAVVGAVIILLIGMFLFEHYADCQAKGGSLVLEWGRKSPHLPYTAWPTTRGLECQIEQSPSHSPTAKP
jgi:hypothetical protein